MFNKDIDIKYLNKIKRYKEFEEELVNLENVVIKNIGKSTLEKNIYAIEYGNFASENKFLITASNHGEEVGGTFGALSIAKDLSNPTKELEDFLKMAYICVVPCIDPDGFNISGRKFIDSYGNSELYPVDPGRKWSDINGTWNRDLISLPQEVKVVRSYIDSFNSWKMHFDLHETVPSLRNQADILENYGILVLESLPLGEEGVGKEIIEHIKRNYFGVYKSNFLDAMSKLSPLPPQTITKGEGRADLGPLITSFRKAMMVLSDYMMTKYNIPSYTFETFYTALDYRVGSQIAGVEGGLMAAMNLKIKEKNFIKKEKVKLNKDFYLLCNEIAKSELNEGYHIRVYKPNDAKEKMFAWDKNIELEFKKRIKHIEVFYFEK